MDAPRVLELENEPYTLKEGEFRLLATPSLGLDWNDNVNLSKADAKEDFILRPQVALRASYPVTSHDLLRFSGTIGYDKYFQHDELSRLRVESGSELAWDIFVKDVSINLHDRFHYAQDSATEPGVANTGKYGEFENTAGAAITRELRNFSLSVGYDHQNLIATSSEFDYRNYGAEEGFARVGVMPLDRFILGVEGTAAFTSYDQKVLNDSQVYSAGLYGDWRPGVFFRVQPRVGYTLYDFRQTSLITQAHDLETWYSGLILSHDVTEAVSYSLSAGHEVRLGIESDWIEDWYVRPAVTFGFFQNLQLKTYLSYEHGRPGGGKRIPLEDEYDWYGGGLSLAYSVIKNVTVSLNYRLTLRASQTASREYTQNVIGLMLTYTPK